MCVCSYVNGSMCTQLYVWKPRLPWEASSLPHTWVLGVEAAVLGLAWLALSPTEPSPLALSVFDKILLHSLGWL